MQKNRKRKIRGYINQCLITMCLILTTGICHSEERTSIPLYPEPEYSWQDYPDVGVLDDGTEPGLETYYRQVWKPLVFSLGWSEEGKWAYLQYESYDNSMNITIVDLVSDTVLWQTTLNAKHKDYYSIFDYGSISTAVYEKIRNTYKQQFTLHKIDNKTGSISRLPFIMKNYHYSVVFQEHSSTNIKISLKRNQYSKTIGTISFPYEQEYPGQLTNSLRAYSVLLSPDEKRMLVLVEQNEYTALHTAVWHVKILGAHLSYGFK